MAQNIFVRYDSGLDKFLLSDTAVGPESPSNSYSSRASKGDTVIWHWRGAHQNNEFVSASPKDVNRNPFDQTNSVGEILSVTLRTGDAFATGSYSYNLLVSLNGINRPIDPILQIH